MISQVNPQLLKRGDTPCGDYIKSGGQGVVSSNLAAPTNKISLRARGRLCGRRSANKRPRR
jgi:hypothetical protein